MSDAFRFDESCLSVFVYKLRRPVSFKSQIQIPADIREGIQLNAVTKVTVDSDTTYDEGDTRSIRKDIVLTLEAVINADSIKVFSDTYQINTNPSNQQESIIVPSLGNEPGNVGGTWPRGGNPVYDNFDTGTLVTFLEHFLNTQGLYVDLSNFPSTISNITPALTSGPSPVYGTLVDSFNGPKTLSIRTQAIPGGNGFYLTWKVRFSVSEQSSREGVRSNINDGGIGVEERSPGSYDISSELRLDIDKDGDLEVVVSGTIYAPNPYILYQARDHLNIILFQDSGRFVETRNNKDYSQDPWTNESPFVRYKDIFAQINGFHKDVSFNVEKNGRSARFLIRYTQIKSNSAHPYGVRDVQFSHEIQSSLLGEGFQGSGFNFWKSVYAGSIRIPHRFNASHAWWVIFHWISEKTRKLKRLSSKDELSGQAKKIEEGRYDVKIGGMPLSMRIKHEHFKREVTFSIEWLILCPLQQIFAASLLFARLNNDYNKRLSLPRESDGSPNQLWRPKPLSYQWMVWFSTVDPQYGYMGTDEFASNPVQAAGINNSFRNPRQNLDYAGNLIVEGGHSINPYLPYQGRDLPQSHVLISTVVDPREKDYQYFNSFTNQQSGNIQTNSIDDIIYANFLPNPVGTNLDPRMFAYESNLEDPLLNNSIARTTFGVTSRVSPETGQFVPIEVIEETIDPRYSWLAWEEEYEVKETHPTIPVEALGPVDASWHGEPKLLRQYINSAPDAFTNPGSFAQPIGVANRPSIEGQIDNRYASGMYLNTDIRPTLPEWNPEHPEQAAPTQRKTYAVKGSRYFVTVRGFAIRVQYKIAIPTVISIAGAPAVKVGEGRFMLKPSGMKGSYPVYYAAWEQTYTVDKSLLNEDIIQGIETTGSQIIYS